MTKRPGLPHLPDTEDYDLRPSGDRPLWQDLVILAVMALAVGGVALWAGHHGLP